jgi:hypothetical protein
MKLFPHCARFPQNIVFEMSSLKVERSPYSIETTGRPSGEAFGCSATEGLSSQYTPIYVYSAKRAGFASWILTERWLDPSCETERISRYLAWLPEQHIETENRRPNLGAVLALRFYRGGFQTNGLQTLCSRTSISISCNVALGEPIK